MKKKHVHILAICGYTTTGLALMARDLGYKVTGSDEDAYPPNSDTLTKAGISWTNSHNSENLVKWGVPDLVIQANQIRKGNPELLAARKMGLRITSDSEFFYELTKKRKRVVVCGSHGKTTTSALIAWILERAGRSPGFRLGTVTKNFNNSVRLGNGQEFVFEGDEYTTTYSDKRPKFFHFHSDVAVINNIEWDHPDIFKTPTSYLNIFKNYLVSKMSTKGILVCNAEDKNVMKVTEGAPCRVVTFGLKSGDFLADKIKFIKSGTSFDVIYKGDFLASVFSVLPGLHNVKNSLAAMAVCYNLKVSIPSITEALRSFKGTSRRFEVTGIVRGVTVIDDYAHHPTKARETIAAAKSAYPNSRVFAIYIPHTYSRTKALLSRYAEAFNEADFVIIPDIEPARERHLQALIHARDLVSKISGFQKNVYYIPDQNGIIDFVLKRSHQGDVILCMSVRGFEDLAAKLVKALYE